jgi:hypothetical protein
VKCIHTVMGGWLLVPSVVDIFVDSGFLGVVMIAFSPHLFVWK